MAKIHFKTKVIQIGRWIIIRLPLSASEKLSTRGLAMVAGTINGFNFQSALEPDGMKSHWFKLDKSMRDEIGITVGDSVTIEIEQISKWSEPKVPQDIKRELGLNKSANVVWDDITPLARWEWIRWIQSTKQESTRMKRIDVAMSKLKSGKRRPCCFNTNQCTVPDVSNNGILIEEV